MPTVGIEPAFPASEQPQIHTLDRATTGIDIFAKKNKSVPLQARGAQRVPGS